MAVAINCDMGESFGLYKMGDDDGIMPRLIEFQPGVPRQFRPARFVDTDVAARSHRSLVSSGHERAGRDVALDIGMIQRIEHCP